MNTIYLDYAATTPLDERVLEVMLPYMTQNFGNASSAHHFGQKAKVMVEEAREKVASLINAEPSEIIFTSGGTESDNAAIRGLMAASPEKNVLVTSPIEHHAVLTPVESADSNEWSHVFVQPDETGIITSESLNKVLHEKTALVSLMHVNNELGTLNNIEALAHIAHTHDIPFHTDAVQSLGKIPLDVKKLDIDILSGSAHKIYGPKGVGLMYVKNGSEWKPLLTGGSQERRRRGGTTNVPGVIGFARALELAVSEMDKNLEHYRTLREILFRELSVKLKACNWYINGNEDQRVPHILNIAFLNDEGKGIDGEMLLLNLDIEGICVSNGSACTSGAVEPSHVLLGMGLSEERAMSSIRISFGKDTSEKEVVLFVERLNNVLTRMFDLVS